MNAKLISAVLGAIWWSVYMVGAATADPIPIENASFENAGLDAGG